MYQHWPPRNGRSPAERTLLRRGSGLTPVRRRSAAVLSPGRPHRSRLHRLASDGARHEESPDEDRAKRHDEMLDVERRQEPVDERQAAEEDQDEPDDGRPASVSAGRMTMPFGLDGRLPCRSLGRKRLERYDDRHTDVEQHTEAAHEDRQEPDHADEGRVEVEELGQARGDTGQAPVVTATIETALHLHPPIGLISTTPKLTLTLRSARCDADA